MYLTLYRFRRYAKRILAAILFTVLLLGAAAAALSATAAAISALSNTSLPAYRPPVPTTAPVRQTGPAHTYAPSQQPPAPGGSQPAASNGVDRLNQAIDHMQSPVGHALDSGGIVLGEKVQEVFGQILSGVLQTLFLEQSDQSVGGQP